MKPAKNETALKLLTGTFGVILTWLIIESGSLAVAPF